MCFHVPVSLIVFGSSLNSLCILTETLVGLFCHQNLKTQKNILDCPHYTFRFWQSGEETLRSIYVMDVRHINNNGSFLQLVLYAQSFNVTIHKCLYSSLGIYDSPLYTLEYTSLGQQATKSSWPKASKNHSYNNSNADDPSAVISDYIRATIYL